MLTLVVALCAAQRARCSSNRGETARDRKFGRPRNGLARARRGVTRDGAGKRRCELISLFSVRILFSKTLSSDTLNQLQGFEPFTAKRSVGRTRAITQVILQLANKRHSLLRGTF